MIGLIGLVAAVYWVGTTYGTKAGVIATAAAVILLLVLFCAGWSRSTSAVHNWIRYWARGGALTDSRETSRREYRAAARKRRAYVENCADVPVRSAFSSHSVHSASSVQSGSASVCHYCGRFVRARSQYVLTSDGRMRTYYCPRCGQLNLTKTGA